MPRFVEPPASGGLRLPVFFTPIRDEKGLPPAWDTAHGIYFEEAQHTIVVLLADARMLQVVHGTGPQWTAFFQEGVKRTPPESPHYVFALALDSDGQGLSPDRHIPKIEPQVPTAGDAATTASEEQLADWGKLAADDASLQIALQIIQKLDPKVGPRNRKLRLFLSHAKADLDPDEKDPVRMIQNDIKDETISGWFDKAKIVPSDNFAEEIEKGIRDCSIMISVVSDMYSSRYWCQREILEAKRVGAPLLVVDALESGEPRSFPYLGNAPTVHWSRTDLKQDARKVVSRAARETLRLMANRLALEGEADGNELVLATAPEAVSLANWPKDRPEPPRFLYPDPPVSEQELGVLKALNANAEFTTPLTRLARQARGRKTAIAVSIGNSNDLARRGLSTDHERTLSDEIHLYLLLAGCQIAYGGSLDARFDRASNFTMRLFELARSYSSLATQMTGSQLAPILNYAPWPLRLGYTDATYRLFGKVAECIEAPRPSQKEVPESDEALFPIPAEGNRTFPLKTPQQRFAWARGLTAMRSLSTKAVKARIAIGGRTDNYSGLYPGIVEEAWMSLVIGQPLYVMGAFGGAARIVIEALTNGDGDQVVAASQPEFAQQCRELAKDRGMELLDGTGTTSDLELEGRLVLPERMAADFVAKSKLGLEQALNNGLSDEENRALFRETEPSRMCDLILRGLEQRFPAS